MTAINGISGTVKIGVNTVAEIDNWTLSIDTDLYDTTAFGSAWHTFIAGLRQGSGSFSGRWYQGDTNGQAVLQTDALGGIAVTLLLSPNGTNTYTCPAFIKQQQIKAPVNGTIDVTFNFTINGAITYA